VLTHPPHAPRLTVRRDSGEDLASIDSTVGVHLAILWANQVVASDMVDRGLPLFLPTPVTVSESYGTEIVGVGDALIQVARHGPRTQCWRRLPDGRRIFMDWEGGNGWRVAIANRYAPQSFDDVWYVRLVEYACRAVAEWDGEGDPEGWWRHPATGRRRDDPVGHPDDVRVQW